MRHLRHEALTIASLTAMTGSVRIAVAVLGWEKINLPNNALLETLLAACARQCYSVCMTLVPYRLLNMEIAIPLKGKLQCAGTVPVLTHTELTRGVSIETTPSAKCDPAGVTCISHKTYSLGPGSLMRLMPCLIFFRLTSSRCRQPPCNCRLRLTEGGAGL